ncbi:MAG TPA: hypothetical protein VEW26_16160 [Allosphingosinicella sp.]|nr:hypothetical protein [Allosphingosinicella sp.]
MAFDIDIKELERLVDAKRYDAIGLMLNEKSDHINEATEFRDFVEVYLEFLSRYRGLDKISADDFLVEMAGVASEAPNYLLLKDLDGSVWGALARMIVYSANRL